MLHKLFVYGTLRDTNVQMGVFGRQLDSTPAKLAGWRLCEVMIEDQRVVELSGLKIHKFLERGEADDIVEGWVLEVTDAELETADEYETANYKRISAHLGDGCGAFVYVSSSCY